MPLPLALAHRRYIQQAGWTEPLRRHIFSRAGLPNALRVLEIGSGTGAVLRTINHGSGSDIFGIDIDSDALQIARRESKSSIFATGEAHWLPFLDAAFDISFFHFVLLWLADPVNALTEARRVTRPGGAVIAFAEPDYSQRIATDTTWAKLAELQAESLRAQGADPNLGGMLADLFTTASIQPIEFGQLQFDKTLLDDDALDLELEVLKSDLASLLPAAEIDKSLADIRETNADIVTFRVPTYYCWGRVE